MSSEHPSTSESLTEAAANHKTGSTTANLLSGAASWYYQNFLRGFCYYLPLLLLFLLPLTLMLGNVASDLGPRYLFFHDKPVKGFVVAVAVTLFWAEILLVGYLLWLRDRRHGRLAAVFEDWLQERIETKTLSDSTPPPSFRSYVWRVLTCLALTVATGALIIWLTGKLIKVLTGYQEPSPSGSEVASSSSERALQEYMVFLIGMGLTWATLDIAGRLLCLWTSRIGSDPRVPQSEKDMPASSTRARSGPRRRIGKWLFGLPVILAWVMVCVAVARHGVSGVKYWGPLLITLGGFLVSAMAVLTQYRWLFWPAVVANLVLSYAGVSWLVSNTVEGALAGVLASFICALILGGCMWEFLPARWEEFRLARVRSLGPLSLQERICLRVAIVYMIAVPLLLMAVAFVPPLASPAPILLLALFVCVALYGAFNYVFRRSFVIVLLCFVMLALVSHIQRYQMRLENDLHYYFDDGILPLGETLRQEVFHQDRFDEALAKYQKSAEPEALSKQITALKEEVDAETLADRHKELAAQIEQRNELKEKWKEIELTNRIRAGRFLSSRRHLLPDLWRELNQALPKDARLLATTSLKTWRPEGSQEQGAPQGQERPLVVIAVSGGGIRAAVWTFLVLKKLELEFAEQGIDFPSHVRLITGASGGMVGAAYYVATLPHPSDRPPQKKGLKALQKRKADLEEQQTQLSSDFLTPVIRRLVLHDLPSWFSVWWSRYDRGQALDEAWDNLPNLSTGKSGALRVPFKELRHDEAEGWRPSLVFTPMMIEDGRRLIISNLDLRSAISNDGLVLPDKDKEDLQSAENHSIEALELFRMFPEAQDTFTVATAARLSASFPYIGPAVSIPTVPRRRVVDAGYYDNYGVSLAASWLFSGSNELWLRQFKDILFIQIRDGVEEGHRQLRDVNANPSYSWRVFEELTSPPEGLFSARAASSSFRNDGQLELLGLFLKLRQGQTGENWQVLTWKEADFLVANFELEKQASLSWYLTDGERSAIASAEGSIAAKILDLRDTWWTKKVKVEPLKE
jgi:hypothetical protein